MLTRMLRWPCAIVCVLAAQQLWAQNSVTIGGVEYASVDAGPAFVEEPRPTQDWQAPEPTSHERQTGMLLFRTADPGEYFLERIPRSEERFESLASLLTPGETVSQWLGFRSLGNLSAVRVHVKEVAGLSFDVRRIHCWPQRSTWFNSRTYQIIPELLLKQENGQTQYPVAGGVLEWKRFDVTADQTVGLWINTTASADLAPGVYNTTITLESEGKPSVEIPFAVEVYPFTLPAKLENRRWILYAWPNRYRAGADPRLDIREMVKYGIDGFLDNAYLMVSVSQDENGKLVISDRANSKRWVEKIIAAAQEEGMRGPFGLWTTPVNRDLARVLGVDMTKPWPASMHEGVRQVKAYFDEEYAKLGITDWMSFASDEPKPGNIYAIEAMKAWHAAGARTYCTAYTGTYEETAAWITDANIGYGDRKSRALVRQQNARQWVIGDGTYMGAHEMARHRRRAGVHFYLSDAYGCAIWRWGGVHGDPFNDFDGSESRPTEPADQILAYPQMARANDWSTYLGPIPTIAWESIRDGINDYKYLAVLQQSIDRAQASDDQALQARARAAADTLRRMRDAFNDSAEKDKGKNVFKIDTSSLANIRQWAAGEIVALQRGLEKKTDQPAVAQDSPVQIRVLPRQDNAARNAALLAPPVLSIPQAARAPRIDGVLDEKEWAAAAKVSIPASAPTEARIMRDDQHVYVVWVCREPELNRMIPADRASDSGPVWSQDSVELFIAPAEARHQPAHVMINHLGRWESSSHAVKNWDAKAKVSAKHTAEGYIVEMALPWETLRQVSSLSWNTVALNFCRVRNVNAGELDRGKFNWAYGTGNFHQPERFGVGLLDRHEYEVLRTFSEVSSEGVFSIGAEVRNTASRPIVVKIEKQKGRHLLMSFRGVVARDGDRAIQPGQVKTVTYEVPLRQRREQWTFHWKPSLGEQTFSAEFTAPGTEDLHALNLEREHFIARPGDELALAPLLAVTQQGFLRVSAAGAESVQLPLGSSASTSQNVLTIQPSEGVTRLVVELLNRQQKPLVRREVTVVVLPK